MASNMAKLLHHADRGISCWLDYATHNFLQWYVAEQIEEEAVARTILDKINLIGNDKGGLYLFDRDIQQLTVESAAFDNPK